MTDGAPENGTQGEQQSTPPATPPATPTPPSEPVQQAQQQVNAAHQSGQLSTSQFQQLSDGLAALPDRIIEALKESARPPANPPASTPSASTGNASTGTTPPASEQRNQGEPGSGNKPGESFGDRFRRAWFG